MKKRILAIILATAMVLSLAACGSKADEQERGEAASAEVEEEDDAVDEIVSVTDDIVELVEEAVEEVVVEDFSDSPYPRKFSQIKDEDLDYLIEASLDNIESRCGDRVNIDELKLIEMYLIGYDKIEDAYAILIFKIQNPIDEFEYVKTIIDKFELNENGDLNKDTVSPVSLCHPTYENILEYDLNEEDLAFLEMSITDKKVFE